MRDFVDRAVRAVFFGTELTALRSRAAVTRPDVDQLSVSLVFIERSDMCACRLRLLFVLGSDR